MAIAIIIDQASNHPIDPSLLIDPMMHQSPQSMNTESDSEADKDTNGVNVPKEEQGDGNGKPTRSERAQQKKAKKGNDGAVEYNQEAEHKSGLEDLQNKLMKMDKLEKLEIKEIETEKDINKSYGTIFFRK